MTLKMSAKLDRYSSEDIHGCSLMMTTMAWIYSFPLLIAYSRDQIPIRLDEP